MTKYILILFVSTFLSCQQKQDNGHNEQLEKQWLTEKQQLDKLFKEEQYEQAFTLANKRLEIANEHFTDNFRLSNAYNDLGLLYLATHDYPKAEAYFKKALATKNTKGKNLAVIYGNLGTYYNGFYQLDLADQYFTKAINEYKKEEQLDTAAVYQLKLGRAKIFSLKKQYEQAEQVILEVSDYSLAKKDTSLMNATLSATGLFCFMKDDYPCALKAYSLLSNYYQRKNWYTSYAGNLNSIAAVLLYQLEYDKAIDSFQKAAQIKLDLYKDPSMVATEVKNIAAVYDYKKDSLKAKEYRDLFEKIKK